MSVETSVLVKDIAPKIKLVLDFPVSQQLRNPDMTDVEYFLGTNRLEINSELTDFRYHDPRNIVVAAEKDLARAGCRHRDDLLINYSHYMAGAADKLVEAARSPELVSILAGQFVKGLSEHPIYADAPVDLVAKVLRNGLQFQEFVRELENSKDDEVNVIPDEIRLNGLEDEVSQNSVVYYSRIAEQYPVYKTEEEREALRRIEEAKRNGNMARYEELVSNFVYHNFRLVIAVCKKYVGHGVALDDLIQEANLKMSGVVSKFRLSEGTKFSTYAVWWIRQTCQRAIANDSRTMRVPVHAQEEIQRLSRLSGELAQELGRMPTNDELAVRADMSLEKVLVLQRASLSPVSIYRTVGSDDGVNDHIILDLVPGDEDIDDSGVTSTERWNFILEILRNDDFDESERRALVSHFNLDGKGERTYIEIGKEIGLSRESARILVNEAKTKFRKVAGLERGRAFI